MEVPCFLPLHGQDSVRSSQVSGFSPPITIETGKHANPVLAKDHLRAGEEGRSNSELYLVILGRLRDLSIIAQYHATCQSSIKGNQVESRERRCYDRDFLKVRVPVSAKQYPENSGF